MQQLHNDEDPEVEDLKKYMLHLYHLYAEHREELYEDARATMAAVHKKMEAIRCPVWTTPKEGDMVLLWNVQMGKHMGKKLESWWSELHQLVKVNPGGVSRMVCKLYGD